MNEPTPGFFGFHGGNRPTPYVAEFLRRLEAEHTARVAAYQAGEPARRRARAELEAAEAVSPKWGTPRW